MSRSSRQALGNAVSAIEYRPMDLPEERYRVQHAELEAVARVERRPVSEVVREAIDRLVETRRKDPAFERGSSE
jgi:hypothetical protein